MEHCFCLLFENSGCSFTSIVNIMAQITFSDIASFINYSRSTQIEPMPWKEEKGRWQIHNALHSVHTAKYPFAVVYFFSEATQWQMTEALRQIPQNIPDVHVVYPESQSKNLHKLFESGKWPNIKNKWTTREFLLSFIKVELDAYLQKLRTSNPSDYIDPSVETPSGFKRKVPNPIINYLIDGNTTSQPLNGTLAIVLAEAGQGKTYMSRHLVGQLAEARSNVFPIYVDSSQWRGLTLDDQRSLFKTITHSFRHFGTIINWVDGHEEEFLKITLSADLFRIVFDGFDEFILRNRGEVQALDVLETLASLARDTGSRIVITSRTSFWETNIPASEFNTFIHNTPCYSYIIRAFDQNHAANYFGKNLKDAKEKGRASNLFNRLVSESKELTGRGFMLKLIADLVQKESTPESMMGETDGTLAWLLLKLCERESLRQQLPFDGATQIEIFKVFAKEIAEGAQPTTSFLRLCVQTARESLHSKNLDQAIEAFKSHPLLRKVPDQDLWSFSQEQILIGLLALQIEAWNDAETRSFLNKSSLEPDRLHDLGALVVDLLRMEYETDSKIIRLRRILERLSIEWQEAFRPGFVVQDGRRLAGIISLLAVERLSPGGSTQHERAQMLQSLVGGRTISRIFFSGTISRFDFSGMTFSSCLFDRVAWVNCKFDERTTFESCKFHGGIPAERCVGLGAVQRTNCKLDPEAEKVFASVEVAEGRRSYTEADLRNDFHSLITRFIIPGGIGLKTVASQHLEKGSFGHSKYRKDILEVFKSLVIDEHHMGKTGGFHIRAAAEDAVKFYASNNVFTGPLDEAFGKLSKKIIRSR